MGTGLGLVWITEVFLDVGAKISFFSDCIQTREEKNERKSITAVNVEKRNVKRSSGWWSYNVCGTQTSCALTALVHESQ